MALTIVFTNKMFDNEEHDNLTCYDDTSDNTTGQNTNTLCTGENLGLQTFNNVVRPMLYSLIFLLGVTANVLMITVLLRRWRLMRITEIYLLHLAVADLMLLFTFPFSVVENFTGWVFGLFFCKLLNPMKSISFLCGSLLLGCIGFDRYLAIVHAIPSVRSRRPRAVHLTCSVLWLICFGLSVPDVVFFSVKQDDLNASRLSCYYTEYDIHAYNWVLTKRVLDHICFFLPLAVMSHCYTSIVITLCKSQKSPTKQGAIRLALLVTIVFCICWLPYNITLLVQTLFDMEVINFDTCESYGRLQATLEVTNILGLSHCCLNPFLYAFVGVQFRNELIHLLCKLGCGRVCLPFIRVRRQSRPSMSDVATTMSTTM